MSLCYISVFPWFLGLKELMDGKQIGSNKRYMVSKASVYRHLTHTHTVCLLEPVVDFLPMSASNSFISDRRVFVSELSWGKWFS